MYHNERAGANSTDTIGTSIHQKVLESIEKIKRWNSDSSVTEQNLIYISFLHS